MMNKHARKRCTNPQRFLLAQMRNCVIVGRFATPAASSALPVAHVLDVLAELRALFHSAHQGLDQAQLVRCDVCWVYCSHRFKLLADCPELHLCLDQSVAVHLCLDQSVPVHLCLDQSVCLDHSVCLKLQFYCSQCSCLNQSSSDHDCDR